MLIWYCMDILKPGLMADGSSMCQNCEEEWIHIHFKILISTYLWVRNHHVLYLKLKQIIFSPCLDETLFPKGYTITWKKMKLITYIIFKTDSFLTTFANNKLIKKFVNVPKFWAKDNYAVYLLVVQY